MQHCRRVYIFALLVTAFFVSSCAQVPTAPTRPVGALSAEQLKKLIDAKSALFLVDTRTEYEFRKGRIPGAVNIPPHRFDSLASLLPSDKGAHLVFYCRGSG
jgi:predicted sulfurtransferase